MTDEETGEFVDVPATEHDPDTMAPAEQNAEGKTRARAEDGPTIDADHEVVLVPPERGLQP